MGRQEAPRGWRTGAGAERGAWRLWAAAVGGEERELSPWPGGDAGEPSSPSWGCRAGCLGGRGTCGGAGACGDDVSAGRRRGCARWGRPSRDRVSSCYEWSIRIRCHCPNASLPLRLLHPHQMGTSPRPPCCRGLYCCGAARPRFLSTHCCGSLQGGKQRNTVRMM